MRHNGRTLRAYCEMDEGQLTRDASWTLDAAFRPIEGHVRVVQHGQLVGSSFYTFDKGGTRCEALTAAKGRQTLQLPVRPTYLGLHPLIGDAMIALARGTASLGKEEMISTITCSRDMNGETDLTAIPMEIGVTFCGEEDIRVPAGTFIAQKHLLNWGRDWPPATMWVHGEDAIFLKMEWAASPLIFELAELALGTAPQGPQFLDQAASIRPLPLCGAKAGYPTGGKSV